MALAVHDVQLRVMLVNWIMRGKHGGMVVVVVETGRQVLRSSILLVL